MVLVRALFGQIFIETLFSGICSFEVVEVKLHGSIQTIFRLYEEQPVVLDLDLHDTTASQSQEYEKPAFVVLSFI